MRMASLLVVVFTLAGGSAAAQGEAPSAEAGAEPPAPTGHAEHQAAPEKAEPAAAGAIRLTDADGNRLKIAVLEVQVKNVDAETGAIFTEVLTAEVAAANKLNVISATEIAAMIGYEEQKQILGCDDTSCMAEVGGAIGADYLMHSQVGKVGETFVVNIKVINVTEAKALKRVYKTVDGKIDLVLQAIRASVAEIFGMAAPEAVASNGAASGGDGGTTTAATTTTAKVQPASGGGFPVVPVILWGVGAASLGAAIYFGIDADDKGKQASTGPVNAAQLVSDGQTSMIIANVLYAAGGAAIGTGLLVFLLSMGGDDEPKGVAFAPMLLPDGVGAAVGGSW